MTQINDLTNGILMLNKCNYTVQASKPDKWTAGACSSFGSKTNKHTSLNKKKEGYIYIAFLKRNIALLVFLNISTSTHHSPH